MKCRYEKMEEVIIRLKNGTQFASSIPFLERKTYTAYTILLGSADRFLQQTVPHEACRQKPSTLFPTRESALQVSEIV